MSGLSANVSLGQPVVPVPGAVGGAPGPDEQSFRDAFQEAQATRCSSPSNAGLDDTNRARPGSRVWRPQAAGDSTPLGDETDPQRGAASASCDSPTSGPASRAAGRSLRARAGGGHVAASEGPEKPDSHHSTSDSSGCKSFGVALVAAESKNAAGAGPAGETGDGAGADATARSAGSGVGAVGAVGAAGAVAPADAAESTTSPAASASAPATSPSAEPTTSAAAPAASAAAASGATVSDARAASTGADGKRLDPRGQGRAAGAQSNSLSARSRETAPNLKWPGLRSLPSAAAQQTVGSAEYVAGSAAASSTASVVPATTPGAAEVSIASATTTTPTSAASVSSGTSSTESASDAVPAGAAPSAPRSASAVPTAPVESAMRAFLRATGRLSDDGFPTAPDGSGHDGPVQAAAPAGLPAGAADAAPAAPATASAAAADGIGPVSNASVESAIRAFLRATGRLSDNASPEAPSGPGQEGSAVEAAARTELQATGSAQAASAAVPPSVPPAPANSPASDPTYAPKAAAANTQYVAPAAARPVGLPGSEQPGRVNPAAAAQGRTSNATISSARTADSATPDRSTPAGRSVEQSIGSGPPPAGGAASDVAALVAQVTSSAPAAPTTVAPRPTQGVVAAQSAQDLVDSADRLMNQVVKTIHTYQTSGGPALEARVSDPVLGDVRVIVTGQAGEIIQAQLVVRDRFTADALLTAAARSHASGEALTGVNVSVRSELGGSWTSNRRSGGAAESMAWGQSSGSHSGTGDAGAGRGNEPGNPTSGGNGTGTGPSANGSHGSGRSPVASGGSAGPAPTRRSTSGLPKTGRSSLDIRA